MRLRRTLAIAATVIAASSVAVPAYAAWSSAGTGSAAAEAGTLTAPGAPGADAAATHHSIPVKWAAAPSPGGTLSVSYLVQRAAYSATAPAESAWQTACDSAATTITTTSCTDSGLFSSTDYMYRATARYGAWRATGASSGKLSTTHAPVTDTTPPALTIATTPACGITNGSNYSCTGDYGVAPGDSGTLSVTVKVKGTETEVAGTLVKSSTGTWTYSGSSVPPRGTMVLTISQSDAAGNTTTKTAEFSRG